MGGATFEFKQFTIRQDRCPMKVGTDGVLLGAWAPLHDPATILDIGTGTGLIALMLAQRFPLAQLTGIDINADAVAQARQNVQASPFADRISVTHTALQDFSPAAPSFQAIVCNPPFFEDSLHSPDAGRTQARHTASLPFSTLVAAVARLLPDGGQFAVVLPSASFTDFHRLCFAADLNLERLCHVSTTAVKPPKRVLACFTKKRAELTTEQLVLMDGSARSEAYAALTADFYIR